MHPNPGIMLPARSNQLLWEIYPNLATILHPLNNMLGGNVKWEWSALCDEAVNVARPALVSSKVLVHYNPALPVVWATDASQYSIRTVLSHV